MNNFKLLYSQFLKQQGDWLHFAAHSHHFWPDVSRQGHLQAWDDAALMNDRKWEKIFSQVIPDFQRHLANMLNLKNANMLALAPNTHDLLTRFFSGLIIRPSLKILTTDSEFHSFTRQLLRWQEVHCHLSVTRIPTAGLLQDRKSWLENFSRQAKEHDVIFISQVFFNSGLALTINELSRVIEKLSPQTLVVIDGYHATGAVPTDLSELEGRIYYLGGGYKYLQAGEGACFMLTPKNDLKPTLTGWFAEFGNLSGERGDQVRFAQDGMKYWGATLDPSGWYRFNAVWDLFSEKNISISVIHAFVQQLQHTFLENLPKQNLLSSLTPLFENSLAQHGHFLTYQARTSEEAQTIARILSERKIHIDVRGDRVRFGFGLYQDQTDVFELLSRLKPA